MNEWRVPLARQRNFALPDDLRAAIERVLGEVPSAQWVRAARELSERYRAARGDERLSLPVNRLRALGYAALVLPATYAQLRGAMDATASGVPRWAPETLLDLGTGPGTAL